MEERASQVGCMGDIYQAADRVIVWHGPEEPGPDVAWILNDFSPRVLGLCELHGVGLFVGRDAECTDDEIVERLGAADCRRWRGAWVSWAKFMDSITWYRRGWAIQETVLKRHDDVLVLMSASFFNW